MKNDVNNVRGSIWMVLSMAAFALEDMLVKSLTQTLPIGLILVVFGVGGMFVFMAIATFRGEAMFHSAITSKALLVRSLCEVGGRLFFTLALALTPLASASAILQATPLVVTLGAVIFFNESVGYRRWVASGIGFAGVLLVLRPGVGSFEPASLFAVIATIGFAGRDLATRAAPKNMSSVQLGVLGFLMLALAGVVAILWSGELHLPNPSEWLQLGLTIAIGVIAYYALTAAMRIGEISVVAPFRYTRLAFAVILGVIVFAEIPDSLTLAGSVLIVASGLFSMRRQKRAAVR